jgi:L-aspartate oxidase
MWEHAGLERDPEGLRHLHEDPHPLARLVAACALHREESRGAHRRADHLTTHPELDHQHAVVGPAGNVAYERWT